jgi:hypothetical protein
MNVNGNPIYSVLFDHMLKDFETKEIVEVENNMMMIFDWASVVYCVFFEQKLT